MAYLIGEFTRHHSEIWKDQDSLSTVKIVSQIDKHHLITAKRDSDYQIINLETREYYDPEKNAWIKIKTE